MEQFVKLLEKLAPFLQASPLWVKWSVIAWLVMTAFTGITVVGSVILTRGDKNPESQDAEITDTGDPVISKVLRDLAKHPQTPGELISKLRPLFSRSAFQGDSRYENWGEFIYALSRSRLILQEWAEDRLLKDMPEERVAMKRAASKMKNLESDLGQSVWGNPQIVESAINNHKNSKEKFLEALSSPKAGARAVLGLRNSVMGDILNDLISAGLTDDLNDSSSRPQSIWQDLNNDIKKRWQDKPRGDLVGAVVNLRDAMRECQQWYTKYREAVAAGNVDTLPYPNPRVEWERSVTGLGRAMADLDDVLSIFSPATKEKLQYYNDAESLLVGAEGSLRVVADDRKARPDIDLRNGRIGDTFESALNELDRFIRANFTQKEVFDASRNRYRR